MDTDFVAEVRSSLKGPPWGDILVPGAEKMGKMFKY